MPASSAIKLLLDLRGTIPDFAIMVIIMLSEVVMKKSIMKYSDIEPHLHVYFSCAF